MRNGWLIRISSEAIKTACAGRVVNTPREELVYRGYDQFRRRHR